MSPRNPQSDYDKLDSQREKASRVKRRRNRERISLQEYLSHVTDYCDDEEIQIDIRKHRRLFSTT